MSRVHDALRRAEQAGAVPSSGAPQSAVLELGPDLEGPLANGEVIPFRAASDSLMIDLSRPHEPPMKEFRTLRTRLEPSPKPTADSLSGDHQSVPAEGKSLSAINLALAQSHLAQNATLLADFDFRRPIVHTMFGLDRSPGITDYLMGKAALHQIIKRLAGTTLYVMPAGEAVINPLELLNLAEVKFLLESLPKVFNWIILDSLPLLFAADANLLSTLCHATLLIVRIGHTTIDSVTRAMQSLCNNNVLGIVVNGARRGELYSKYTYYHSYYYAGKPSGTLNPQAAGESTPAQLLDEGPSPE
jgi:capsular exopolysaccharide synthesis family protein